MTAVGRFSTRPLYLQVKDMLIQRIAAGDWRPGAAIPNEIELSRELGISVGTVRKALDEMEHERLISRRQGRGTFVIDQTSTEQAVRFSNIRDPDGMRIGGDIVSCTIVAAGANETEARHLELRNGEPIFRIHRVRAHNGVPLMVEESIVPQGLFPGLAQEGDVSPSIVVLAHHFGVLLGRAEEKIRVSAAKGEIAKLLKVAEGAPLLMLDCVVHTIEGRPIEWRLASCNLRENHYLAEMS
ncbi:MAG: GntR family transcriptional regulator [Hyphomicrobium sp.]|jgi:GntR family transcriptional regulator